MTVAELKDKLAALPGDREVYGLAHPPIIGGQHAFELLDTIIVNMNGAKCLLLRSDKVDDSGHTIREAYHINDGVMEAIPTSAVESAHGAMVSSWANPKELK